MTTKERIPIGVIGTGYLGRLHARVLTQMPEVEVVGFVERDDAAAGEVEQQLSLTRFGSIEELAPRIRCAVVATPTTSHFDVASQLIDAGCDVMIEKPITAEPQDAIRLIRNAAETGRLIQVGHVERYNPAIAAIAPLVREPRFIEAERLGIFVGRSLDVDVLLDLMIHDINLVLSLVGREVVQISAIGVPVLTSKVDIANVRLELDDGAIANLTASRVSSERVRKFRLFSTDTYLSVDLKEQEVKGYRLQRSTGEPSIHPLELVIEKKEPLRAELEAFVQCVRDRTEPLVSGRDGLAALNVAVRVGHAIDESLERQARARQ